MINRFSRKENLADIFCEVITWYKHVGIHKENHENYHPKQKMVKRKDKPTDLKTHSLEIYEFLTGYKKEYQL